MYLYDFHIVLCMTLLFYVISFLSLCRVYSVLYLVCTVSIDFVMLSNALLPSQVTSVLFKVVCIKSSFSRVFFFTLETIFFSLIVTS